jgi:hypothetical protein
MEYHRDRLSRRARGLELRLIERNFGRKSESRKNGEHDRKGCCNRGSHGFSE